MGFIDKALSKIGYTKSISTSTYEALVNGYTANQVSNPYANIPAVYKANKAIIDNIAQADWAMSDSDGNIVDTFDEVLLLFKNIYLESGQKLTKTEALQTMAGFLGLYGEIFLVKPDAKTQGEVSGLSLPKRMILPSPKNTMERIAGNNLIGWTVTCGGVSNNYTAEQVIHIKDFNPLSGLRGIAPIDVLMDELRVESKASEHIWSMFVNGGLPSVILSTDKMLSPEQKDQIRRGWEARHGGAKNTGKNALLDNGMTASTLSQNNNEMQLAELIRFAEEKIIGMWRVPKAMFGYTDNLNRATFLGQLNVFWTMTLIPMMDKIKDGLNQKLITPYTANKAFLTFDVSNIEALQEVLWDKIDVAVKLQGLGFTRNEINDRLGLGFETNTIWGNDWYIGFNLQPAGTEQEPVEVPKEVVEVPTKQVKELLTIINGRSYTQAQVMYIKAMNNIHDKLHMNFKKAVNKYFNGLRKRTLDSFDDSYKGFAEVIGTKASINIGWAREEELFAEDIKRWEAEAIAQGIKQGSSITGFKPNDTIMHRASAVTAQRLKFVSSSVIGTTTEQINKEINAGIDAGESVTEIKDRIKGYFNKATNRASTIARTEVTAQLNAGSIMSYQEVGVEKKEWITNIDGFERDAHAEANHQVVGINEDFFVGGEYMSAPAMGSLPENNINCFIPTTKVQGTFDTATRSFYTGKVLNIRTKLGNILTVTPNHPILTDRGWVLAKDLNNTDNLLSYVADSGSSLLGNINNNNEVPSIDQVFNSIKAYGGNFSKVSVGLDFNGDGEFFNNDVDIVTINRELLEAVDTETLQLREDVSFMNADPKSIKVKGFSPFAFDLERVFTATPSLPCFNDLGINFFRTLLNDSPFNFFSFGLGSKLNTLFNKVSSNDLPTAQVLFSELVNADTTMIKTDNIVDICESDFSGHVYDLQSKDGYIIAENIITSNCRCYVVPAME